MLLLNLSTRWQYYHEGGKKERTICLEKHFCIQPTFQSTTLTSHILTYRSKPENGFRDLLACTVQLLIIEPIAQISRAHAHGRLAEVVLLMRIKRQEAVS